MNTDSDKITETFEVFSPRWGHTDAYTVEVTSSKLAIRSNTRTAECTLDEDNEPVWTGYNEITGNPLMNIFSNDSIYAPAIIPEALEWTLSQWRERSMDKDEILDGLRELFAWIDETAKGKPSGALWQPYF